MSEEAVEEATITATAQLPEPAHTEAEMEQALTVPQIREVVEEVVWAQVHKLVDQVDRGGCRYLSRQEPYLSDNCFQIKI
jgi:hypothetical protein